MVSFRKSLLLTALLVLVTGIAAAQAVQPLSCTANAGVPPIARAEGIAEEVGQVVITCTGGNRAPQDAVLPTINVQVFLNTNLTSRLYAATTGLGPHSEALLLIDDPQPTQQTLCPDVDAGCPNTTANYVGTLSGNTPSPFAQELTYINGGPNVFRAKHGSQLPGQLQNSVTWLGVPFNAPGTAGTRTLRLSNIRANASALATAGNFIPSTIAMAISISGTASLPLAQTQLTVAFVQAGLDFTVSKRTYNQCELPTPSQAFSIKFSERFGTAFRPVGGGAQSMPNGIYNTESMFSNTTQLPSPASTIGYGVASQETRFQASFTNIPTGVTLTLGTPTTTGGLTVNLISGTTGSVINISNQAATVVWGVVTANPNQLESVTVPISVSWNSLPGLGTALVRGDYSPLSSVFTASTSAPVPRFVPNAADPLEAFTIVPCQTNLLFPYVTNQAGFDTGLVVSNTSLDPYGTAPQTGPCTMFYYGKTAAGASFVDNFTTTSSVAAGEHLIWLLSAGGSHGAPVTPGFQGYLIVRCNFQFAHGFAFVSDLGAQRLAMGYIPLVLDQNVWGNGPTRTKVQSEALNQ